MTKNNDTHILEALKSAIPVFADNPETDLYELEAPLTKAGIDHSLSKRIIEFMPLAFGRVHMEAKGLKFDEHYIRRNPKTNEQIQRRLMDESVYRDAYELATYIVATNRADDAFMSIVYRSAELWSVNDLLTQGSKPENIMGLPPLLQWDDDLDLDSPITESPVKKKWEFWK